MACKIEMLWCEIVKLRKEARIFVFYEKKKKQNIGQQNRKKKSSKKFYEIVKSPGKKVSKSNNKII